MIVHDYHVHSTFSDGVDDLDTMMGAAVRAGLTTVGFADHVRASTAWLPAYVEAIDRIRSSAAIPVWRGVESKILDTSGKLDLPADLSGIEYLAIADHQVPTRTGPVHPDEIRRRLESGALSAAEVMDALVDATVAAAKGAPVQVIVVHPFSVLPKVGLEERRLPAGLLSRLGSALREAGAWVEVNEKWQCPSRRVVRRLSAAGVTLVAGSDSHRAADLGRFDYVRQVAAEFLSQPLGRRVRSR